MANLGSMKLTILFLAAACYSIHALIPTSKHVVTLARNRINFQPTAMLGRNKVLTSSGPKYDDSVKMDDSAELAQEVPSWDFNWSTMASSTALIALPLIFYALCGSPTAADAIDSAALSTVFDPAQFQPVCPASDGVYQFLKLIANGLVGKENVVEYGPLIASVLLRVRLELCVLESFLYEAVVPFVQKKGLSWVLPLHETVETFLAGTIFAVASNFILLGSTKILSVLFIYLDALTGMPARFVGGTIKKASPKDSPGSAFGFGLKTYGDILGKVRSLLEAGDTFVGRYLVVATTIYIAFKFAHFKFFNDIF